MNKSTRATHPRQDFSQVLTPRISLARWNLNAKHFSKTRFDGE
ncbi:hypothetical protein [Paracoccus sp. (in: a-proteobacteria)]|nr:hypothetical protein [Paracoccus sp. (in: a-proteobacteria)]